MYSDMVDAEVMFHCMTPVNELRYFLLGLLGYPSTRKTLEAKACALFSE
jgi:hypothetical protein